MSDPDQVLDGASKTFSSPPRPKRKKKGALSRGWKSVRAILFRRKEEISYETWVKKCDTLKARDRKDIKKHIARLAYQPKISVVMPAYEPNERWFREAIESVRAQLYENWELCVADDASPSDTVVRALGEYAGIDSRIKWMRRERNGHISAATNSALTLASGEFVALMDHDDILPEQALYEVVVELNDHPDADLIYSDEDRIDDAGNRFDPNFKTDWNPELFLCQNMFSHLGVYRRSLIEEIGGLREGFEGSQDYDLALRASRKTTPAHIRHIPAMLYHWRGSTDGHSFSQKQLDKCIEAARRAKTEHLRALDDDGIVEPHPTISYWERVRRPVPEPAPLVTLIVPTRNGAHLLRPCLDGIFHRTNYKNFEIIIIDHESDEKETIELLQEAARDPRVSIMRYQGEFNYSDMNNKAVALARGELIALINNDIDVIDPDWLTEMVSLAVRPEYGAVGAKLLYPDGSVQHAGVILGIRGVAGHFHVYADKDDLGYCSRLQITSNVSAVTAACMVVKKSIFEEVGGLNAVDLKVTYNDIDFSLKIAARGYLNVWTPYALLYHHELPSRGRDLDPAKAARFQSEIRYMKTTWREILERDPFYNVNFSLKSPNCDLIMPSRRVRPWKR